MRWHVSSNHLLGSLSCIESFRAKYSRESFAKGKRRTQKSQAFQEFVFATWLMFFRINKITVLASVAMDGSGILFKYMLQRSIKFSMPSTHHWRDYRVKCFQSVLLFTFFRLSNSKHYLQQVHESYTLKNLVDVPTPPARQSKLFQVEEHIGKVG
jgi:hypothetical protein